MVGSKKRPATRIRLDMTPMVDIAFLLLIFYMATTQFKPPEAKAVTLPQSRSRIELPAKDVITITVTRADSIFVDFLDVVSSAGEQATLTRHTRATDISGLAGHLVFARSKNPNAYIVIKADQYATFGTVQDITKILRANGCPRFLVATDPESTKES